MAKNPNVYKFEIIERIITEVDFTTKEEVVEFARKVRDIALERNISSEIKNANQMIRIEKGTGESSKPEINLEAFQERL